MAAELALGAGAGADDGDEERPNPLVYKPDLYAAAMANNVDEITKLLSHKVPATFVDEKSGWTPLHWAAKHGNVLMMTKLIEGGATAPYHRMVARENLRKLRDARAAEDTKKNNNAHVAMDAPHEENDDGADGAEGAAAAESKDGGYDIKIDQRVDAADGVSVAASITDASASAGVSAKADSAQKGLAEELDEEDDEELDYEAAIEKKLETSVNLLKNTPLLLAASKGHLRLVWMLLLDGYAANDSDSLENNALHLSASSGNAKVLKVLIDDGAYSTKVNNYKNLPIDLATHKECRMLLTEAMEVGASMTAADIAAKHNANLKWYNKLCNKLEAALLNTSGSPAEVIANLTETLRISSEAGLPEALIAQGEKIVQRLEVGMDLAADLDVVRAAMPIKFQKQFLVTVHRLEATILRAKEAGADAGQISFAEDLIAKCEIDYWVTTLTNRLTSVLVAQDPNEHDMNRLKQAVLKGQALQADEGILETADTLCKRLFAELGMSRALASLPIVKMPLKEGAEYPDDYWGENDTGHIVETEGYPHPPADTNEYVWEPSASYVALQTSIAQIKSAYVGAEELGANPDVCLEAKTKLQKAEKDIKVLHVKNESDKLIGIENTQKLCKKKPSAKAKK